MKRRFNERKGFWIILVVLAAIVLFTFIVMTLWNAVLVPVTHVSAVNFWQAAGILLLSKILFGGFRGGGPFGGRRNHWKQGMWEKWKNLTPEEKEKTRQEWRQRCNRWGSERHEEPGFSSRESEKDFDS